MLNDYRISSTALALLQDYLQQHLQGLTTRPALVGADAAQALTYRNWWQLLDQLSQQTGIKLLGLEIGSQVRAEQCGLAGYLLRSSKTLLHALETFVRYEKLLYAGGQSELQESPRNVCLNWRSEPGLSTLQSDLLLTSGLISVLRENLGAPALKAALQLPHALNKEQTQQLSDFFGQPVSPLAPSLQLVFLRDDMHRPMTFADASLYDILRHQAQAQLRIQPEGDPFLLQLRSALLDGLEVGETNAALLAQRLHISERTLHRRLQQRGLCFRELLSETRKTKVHEYMLDPRMSLSEIAQRLGFQEQSSFSRAFQHWYSDTPLKYRKRLLQST